MPQETIEQPTQDESTDIDFSDILDLGQEVELDEAAPVTPTKPDAVPAGVPPPAPATPAPAASAVPAQTPQTTAPVTPVPAAQPTAPPAEAAPAAPAQPAAQPATPAEDFAVVRQRAVDEMAASFVIDQAAQEAMMLTPEGAKVLQTLAAQSTVRAYENVMASINMMLPQLIRNVMSGQSANERIWNQFFEGNKHLEPHREKVYDLAAKYRQLNPQTPADQLMKEIAALAVVRLGLAPVPAEVPVQTGQPPAAPARRMAVPPRPPAAPAGIASGAPDSGDGVPDFLRDIIDLKY